jgi:hypothetical protein
VTPETAETLARDLGERGYRKLFLTADDSAVATVWRDGENRQALEEIVAGDGYGDLERLLAAEVLFAGDGGFPPDGARQALGEVYARALALTGAGDRPIVLTGNLWGFLYHDEAEGPLGEHLLSVGTATVPHLAALLDDDARVFYEGSQEAMLGNRLGYRVKDAAAYYIGKLTATPVSYHEDPGERDAEIDRLRAGLDA